MAADSQDFTETGFPTTFSKIDRALTVSRNTSIEALRFVDSKIKKANGQIDWTKEKYTKHLEDKKFVMTNIMGIVTELGNTKHETEKEDWLELMLGKKETEWLELLHIVWELKYLQESLLYGDTFIAEGLKSLVSEANWNKSAQANIDKLIQGFDEDGILYGHCFGVEVMIAAISVEIEPSLTFSFDHYMETLDADIDPLQVLSDLYRQDKKVGPSEWWVQPLNWWVTYN